MVDLNAFDLNALLRMFTITTLNQTNIKHFALKPSGAMDTRLGEAGR